MSSGERRTGAQGSGIAQAFSQQATYSVQDIVTADEFEAPSRPGVSGIPHIYKNHNEWCAPSIGG